MYNNWVVKKLYILGGNMMKYSKSQSKIFKSFTAILLVMVLVPALLIACTSKPKLSKTVLDGTNKWVSVFEKHKSDKYSELTATEMNDYIAFMSTNKDKGTAEETDVVNKLGDVMEAYSMDSSEFSKDPKAVPVQFTQKDKILKDLIQKYSTEK